jgi:predicted nuclease of restriction endonuclease-like (RecB) superfamily
VRTNFEIGRLIVEHEQQGAQRAEYGKLVLKTLADRLTAEFGRGFSKSNLEYMRRFFLEYRNRSKQIAQMASGQSVASFSLSWSQYIFLLSVDNLAERQFYEIESVTNRWTLPELRRQFDSSLYERLALSRDKAAVRRLALAGQTISDPKDLLKEPYVLEFLGLDEKAKYSESELETAIIDKLEHFLLELGKGFLFEARQKRFTFDEDHFFVDLVFYNRLLRCYVLIDLKIGKLTHQDLGQMQMYVNYFDRYVKQENEHPTIGIILCKKKREALVELTLPKDASIHAKEYKLYLPSKADLKRRLMKWAGEEGKQ